LEYSLKKLRSSINIEYDILLVDDGSETNDILQLSDSFETSYLRIESNNDIFNYSILNNIAASYAKFFEKKTIIFYNNDLWPSSTNSLHNLLVKHNNYKSDISGCRLVYPIEQDYIDIGKPQHLLGNSISKVYNTIQHGGIHFIPQKQFNNTIVYYPDHTWRFYPAQTLLPSLDTRCFAITGAIQIIDIDIFYQLHGFNQSLSSSFQDIDLCIKAIGKNLSVNYIGSEYMYHAESLSIAQHRKNNNTNEITIKLSDHILWALLCQEKLPLLLGYGSQIKNNKVKSNDN
jgi:GT2 family glycosyltransferase